MISPPVTLTVLTIKMRNEGAKKIEGHKTDTHARIFNEYYEYFI